MEQAIRDAGLEENDVSNERTGLIMGSGGPSTRAIVADDRRPTREKGPKKSGRSWCRKRCARRSPPRSPRPIGISGVSYSISAACATSAHCIGAAPN